MLGICLVVVSVVAADGMAPLAPEAFEEAFPQEAVTFFGQEAGLPGGGIATVHVQKDGQPAVLTVEGWYVLDGERWNQRDIGLSEKRSIPGRHLGGSPVLAAAVANEVTYVATEEHLSRYSPAKRGEKAWEDLQAVEGERRWDTGGVRALAFDGKALWAGFGEGGAWGASRTVSGSCIRGRRVCRMPTSPVRHRASRAWCGLGRNAGRSGLTASTGSIARAGGGCRMIT
ncbi:MAG: hypothetical protein HYV26_09820 [Candidatus Hydrogenedentes bacterium]|nr:hypothetical protein [Candidatus Hydrogenedentota bacterium]